MAQPFRLQVVLDVAERRLDAATRELQRLRAHWTEAQAKLDQLAAYRTEYSARLQARLALGLAAHQLRDYQAFMGKLARAIDAQAEEVQRRRLAWEQEHTHWLGLRQRQQALLVLAHRHRITEAANEARAEQKQQNEFALRAVSKPPEGG